MSFNKNYAEYYDLFNRGKDYSKECDFLDGVFKKSVLPIKKILDLGCGTGIHDAELAKRGYNITGLDLSPKMIQIAKEKNPGMNFLVGDMSNFDINEKFDCIICMFSAIGYLTENKQIENFFKTARKHLNENGLLLIDCWNGLGVIHEPPSSREKIMEVERLKIVRKSFPIIDYAHHSVDIRFDISVFEDGNLIDSYEEKHKVRFFFPQELRKYAEDEGIELIQQCPSFEINKELSEKDWNMILIGQKKEDKIIMVSGGFDPLHLGHLTHFKEAKKL
ncbi:MAG: methyltransferase domain-containing protein, partial [Nanoarchaeota archaeon]